MRLDVKVRILGSDFEEPRQEWRFKCRQRFHWRRIWKLTTTRCYRGSSLLAPSG